MGFFVLLALIVLILIYDPYLDITKDKIIIWYTNKEKERTYKIIWENDN